MMKQLLFLTASFLLAPILAAKSTDTDDKNATIAKFIDDPKNDPYERPIGFSLNLGGLSSLTYEGRFHLGLLDRLSLVISPSYQNTIDIVWPATRKERGNAASLFSVKRLNLGAGVRWHFYDFDSKDGFYLEPMVRGGFFWAKEEEKMWSIIPSLLWGYTAYYKWGYMVSFGLGLEYEILLGKKNYYADYLYTQYFTLTKVPLTGELSIGWMF